jgi:disulfide bond formation protein DsbB
MQLKMDKKGGAAAGALIWIVGFFLGLVLILTIIGVFIGIIIWILFFIIGLAAMFAGGKTVVVQQASPPAQSHTIVMPASQFQQQPTIVEKVVVKCPKCGTKNDEDSDFCKKCGKSLNPELKDKKKSSS